MSDPLMEVPALPARSSSHDSSDQSPHVPRRGLRTSPRLISFLKIAFAWIVALALALGHHGFNLSLNGKTPNEEENSLLALHSQASTSAINNAFAVLVTFFLGVSARAAYVQCAWVIAQRRSLTLDGLDALWSCTSNALAFLSRDLLVTGRWITLIAAVPWALPLIVTFIPGTLAVKTQVVPENVPCAIPTFDFTSSNTFWNILDLSASGEYDGPAVLTDTLVTTVLLGGQPSFPSSPCGANNCTFRTTFNGPSLSCVPQSSQFNHPFDTFESLSPAYAVVAFDDGTPVNGYTNWDFSGFFSNATRFSTGGHSNQTVTCTPYNSTYQLLYSFIGGTHSVSIENITLIQPASQLPVDPFFQPSVSNPHGVHSSVLNATTNYYALISSLYSSLVGNITTLGSTSSIDFQYATPTDGHSDVNLPVVQSQLVASFQDGNLTWTSDLVAAAESLLANITLSILSLSDVTETTPATCEYSVQRSFFSYNSHRLLLIYGLGLGCMLLVAVVGVLALWKNPLNSGAGAGFTDFVGATRNPELYDVDFSGTQARRVRLRYGPLPDAGGRIAFGFPESLSSMVPLKEE